MKIAVTYQNGNVFGHFGHAEQFKLYDVEDGQVVSSEVLEASGSGHEAMAELLDDHAVNVLLCGGIGEGAMEALLDAGIEVVSGLTGSADQAVADYLAGAVESTGVNCDHHSHEEGEGCSCGGGCGSEGGCGGGCGGCGHHAPSFEGPNVGKKVRTHYCGTFDDGTQFDSSYDRGEPLEFVCGAGMMIPGFDKAVATMEIGQIVNVHLMPEEAYGYPDPNAIIPVEIAQCPGAEDLNVGEQVYLQNAYGQPFPVRVADKTDTTIVFDANHEMAGKELNFKIELVEVL